MQGLDNSTACNGKIYHTLFFLEGGSLVVQDQQISSVVDL
jgi:hypothetical protein